MRCSVKAAFRACKHAGQPGPTRMKEALSLEESPLHLASSSVSKALQPTSLAEARRLQGALRCALRLVDVLRRQVAHVQASRVLLLTQAHLAGLAGDPP